MATVLALSLTACAADRPLLIQWGQVTPDTKLMRQHVDHWESYLPFDGVVIPVNQQRYAGRYGSTSANILSPEHWPLQATLFGGERADMADYQHAIDDLKATKFRKFKHNFVLISCFPRMGFAMDWFDEDQWQAALHNVRILARVAKRGGCVGLWFDVEQYGKAAMWYHKPLVEAFPDRPKDPAVWRAMIRRRGNEFIKTINEEFPGCKFGLAYGTCIVHWGMTGAYDPQKLAVAVPPPPDQRKFHEHGYGMLAHFVDGLIEGADKDTEIIDGFEMSYYYKTPEAFAVAQPVVKEHCKAYSAIPELYAKRIKLALGLYVTRGLDDPTRTDDAFTPEQVAASTGYAMKETDRYVWIWNERHNFWIKGGPDSKPLPPLQPGVDSDNADPNHLTAAPTADNAMAARYKGVPQAYIDALAEGKRAALAKP